MEDIQTRQQKEWTITREILGRGQRRMEETVTKKVLQAVQSSMQHTNSTLFIPIIYIHKQLGHYNFVISVFFKQCLQFTITILLRVFHIYTNK